MVNPLLETNASDHFKATITHDSGIRQYQADSTSVSSSQIRRPTLLQYRYFPKEPTLKSPQFGLKDSASCDINELNLHYKNKTVASTVHDTDNYKINNIDAQIINQDILRQKQHLRQQSEANISIYNTSDATLNRKTIHNKIKSTSTLDQQFFVNKPEPVEQTETQNTDCVDIQVGQNEH